MRQHAALGRDVKLVDHPVHRIQHPAQVLHVVSDRVDANHRVARAEGEPFIDLRGNTLHIVAGIVRLQAAAKGPRQTDGGIGFFDHRHFFTAVDQISVGADLATAATTSEVSPLRTKAISSLVTSSLSTYSRRSLMVQCLIR